VTRKMMRLLPAAVARPVAFRHVRKIAARYLSGNMRRVGSFLVMEVPRSITLDRRRAVSAAHTTRRHSASCLLCSSAASARSNTSLHAAGRGLLRMARRLARVRPHGWTRMNFHAHS
jgi:hypothetical protein